MNRICGIKYEDKIIHMYRAIMKIRYSFIEI